MMASWWRHDDVIDWIRNDVNSVTKLEDEKSDYREFGRIWGHVMDVLRGISRLFGFN